MKKLIPFLFLPGVALAADYWHPQAEWVGMAGPPGTEAEICYWNVPSGTCASADCDTTPEWTCETVILGGAKAPVWWKSPKVDPGIVRVTNVRWAYTLDVDGIARLMASD